MKPWVILWELETDDIFVTRSKEAQYFPNYCPHEYFDNHHAAAMRALRLQMHFMSPEDLEDIIGGDYGVSAQNIRKMYALVWARKVRNEEKLLEFFASNAFGRAA